MKRILVLSALFLAAATGDAGADCTKNQITGDAFISLLSDKLVCGRPADGSKNDRWQEEHIATTKNSGNLYDYKKGPTDKVDPRVKVGTWAANSNQVTYTYDRYTPTQTFTYSVFLISGDTYSFCTKVKGTEVVRANIITNTNAGCGGTFP